MPTPTFFFNGKKKPGEQSLEDIQKLIGKLITAKSTALFARPTPTRSQTLSRARAGA